MKKLSSFIITLAVFLVASSPCTAASDTDHYSGNLIILNQTPFTLEITESFMESDERGDMGKFVFSDRFKSEELSLMPGEERYIGFGESHTNEVEGYFVFQMRDTDQAFVAHYRFAEDWDDDTWIRLEQLENYQPYPFVSVSTIRSCEVMKGLFSGIHYQHTCAVTFFMDDLDAACIADHRCKTVILQESTLARAIEAKRPEAKDEL